MTQENLHQKFDALRAQLTDQHNELMLKMDALLSALGAPPPTPTATLADLLEELQSINSRVLTLRNAVGIIPTDAGFSLLTQMASLLNRIGTPTGDATTTVLGRLAAVESATVATATALGIPTGDATTTALGLLKSIQFATSNLNNVLGLPNFDGYLIPNYLAAIMLNTSICQCDPQAPDDTDQCLTLLISSGMLLLPSDIVPGLGSINAAVWPGPLPSDIAYGTIFGVGYDKTSLVPTEGHSWDGWRVFVQSTSDNFAFQTTSIARYQTNQWITITGTDEISILVDGSASVVAYLCRHDGSGTGDGPDACSQTPFRSTSVSDYFHDVSSSPQGGVALALKIAVFPSNPPDGLQFTNSLGTNVSNAEITPDTDWNGWSVFVESESTFYYVDPDLVHGFLCNEWRSLSGIDPLVFIVHRPYTLTVTLCPPDETVEPLDCMQSSSFTVDSEPANGYKFRQMAAFTGFPSLTLLSTAELAPGLTVTYDADVIHTGDLAGWEVKYVSGRVRVVHGILSSGIAWDDLDTPGQVITLPANTNYVLFDDFIAPDTNGSGAFTVELCPYNPI